LGSRKTEEPLSATTCSKNLHDAQRTVEDSVYYAASQQPQPIAMLVKNNTNSEGATIAFSLPINH
jgi:hypothetical protein